MIICGGAHQTAGTHAISIDSMGAMSNVLIRDVPPADLEQIRSAAAEQGTSLQSYLREAVHAQASYLRRQEALARTSHRLQGRPKVSDDERDAVLEAIDAAQIERADQLGDRAGP